MVDQLETIPPRSWMASSWLISPPCWRRRLCVSSMGWRPTTRRQRPTPPLRGRAVPDHGRHLGADGSQPDDIEEQQDFAERLTGRRKRQTVPQEFLNRADEVVVVDAPTEPDDRSSELRQRARCSPPMSPSGSSTSISVSIASRHHGARRSDPRLHDAARQRVDHAGQRTPQRRSVPRELFAVYVTQKNLTPEDRSALARNVMLARAQRPTSSSWKAATRSRRFSTTRARMASPSCSLATTSGGHGARNSPEACWTG